MDGSSIITQVTRDDGFLDSLPTSEKGHVVVKGNVNTPARKANIIKGQAMNRADILNHIKELGQIKDVGTTTVTTNGKKTRSQKLFGSILCCFRNTNNNSNNNNYAPINCQLQVPQENGSPKTSEKYLLPPVRQQDVSKKCVVIDLDETLVHSSFKPINNADFVVPVEIDGTVHQVYVLKRPHVDEFLQYMGKHFECVLFTASLAKYADPVSDLLDKWDVFRCRLFRESCVFHKGNYVKDLSRLGRDLSQIVIIDNSPASYIFHRENAVPVSSWFDEMNDTELLGLIPFFERLEQADNVYAVLRTLSDSPASNSPP